MAALLLRLSEGLGTATAAKLDSVLRNHFEVGKSDFYVRCSADELPQVIHLLGSWQVWVAGLGAVAAGFLAKIGQRSADSLWDVVRDALRRPEAKPLSDISSALADVRTGSGKRPTICIGLDIPNDHFGTCVVIDKDQGDGEKIALSIARFVAHAEKISDVMKQEIANGREPVSIAVAAPLEGGGFKIKWATWAKDQQDFVEHEREIK